MLTGSRCVFLHMEYIHEVALQLGHSWLYIVDEASSQLANNLFFPAEGIVKFSLINEYCLEKTTMLSYLLNLCKFI